MQRRNLAVALATLALLLAARDIGLWPGNEVMIPASIVAVAVVVIWAPRHLPPVMTAASSVACRQPHWRAG